MRIDIIFLRRPIAVAMITIAAAWCGLATYRILPVASLPEVDRPTITVHATLPGASPDTVAVSLAEPLQRQLGGISGLNQMSTFSATGGVTILLQFDLAVDMFSAAGMVQAALNAAAPYLPKALPQPPTYWKANSSGFPVAALALTSDVEQLTRLYALADTVVSRQLSTLPGVAQVVVNGAEREGIRILVNAAVLAELKLSLEDIRAAVQQQTRRLPVGGMVEEGGSYNLVIDDQITAPADYAQIAIAVRHGSIVKLGDVASVTSGTINKRIEGRFGHQSAVLLFVYKQANANVVKTVDAVAQASLLINRELPASVNISMVFDRTLLIRASTRDMQLDVVFALALVATIVWAGFRNITYSFVSVISVTITLAGTTSIMWVLGYSMDDLSLMALVISVGFAIDDAIMVLEGTVRIIEMGLQPIAAASFAIRRISFTVVAISASLVAALTPILLIPGIIGRYFTEFSGTLIAAIILSALVSVFFLPAMIAHLCISPPSRGQARRTQGLFDALLRSEMWALERPGFVVILFVSSILISIVGFRALPKTLIPTQNTGILRVTTVGPSDISFEAMAALQRQINEILAEDPAVAALSSYVGTDNGRAVSSGSTIVALKNELRHSDNLDSIILRLRNSMSHVDGIKAFIAPMQDLVVSASSAAARYQFILTGSDFKQVQIAVLSIERQMERSKEFSQIVSDVETRGLASFLSINRVLGSQFGITMQDVDNVLYDTFGQRQIATLYLSENYSRVILEANSDGQEHSSLPDLFLRSSKGAAVPISALMTTNPQHGAMWLRYEGQLPSGTISFDVAPGFNIRDAISRLENIEHSTVFPPGVYGAFKGEAEEARRVERTEIYLALASIGVIYIVLGILYENLLHPLTVLSSLPPSLLGVVCILYASHEEFSFITSIACILLAGLVMKNAILLVDVALGIMKRRRLNAREAILYALELRTRPILMTTLVSVVAALPLAFSFGPGFEFRRPFGVAEAGGLIASQFLTFYLTPSIFVWFESFRASLRRTH